MCASLAPEQLGRFCSRSVQVFRNISILGWCQPNVNIAAPKIGALQMDPKHKMAISSKIKKIFWLNFSNLWRSYPKIKMNICIPCATWLWRSVQQCRRIVEFRDSSLTGYVLWSRRIELSRVFGIDICRIMARKELGSAKKTSYVICSDSENVINPLPGYD
jgi:hypothetical protein